MVLPDLAGLPDLWRSIGRGRHFRLCTVAREPRQSAVTRIEALEVFRRGGDRALAEHLRCA